MIRRWLWPVTTIWIVALTMFVALAAVESWTMGNREAALGFGGWAIALVAVLVFSEIAREGVRRG